MKNVYLVIALALLTAVLAGCGTLRRPEQWHAFPCGRIEGLYVPESVLVDDLGDRVYVANVAAKPGEYWSDDGLGFVGLFDAAGKVVRYRWANSSDAQPLHGPKGMCLLTGKLYIADNTRVLRCDAQTGQNMELVADGFEKVNDLASDGFNVWASDTVAGKIVCITPDGTTREYDAPAGVNGLTFHNGRMYAVSWGEHDVYELDPLNGKPPRPFGLAENFVNLDGIKVLADGSFLVSDFKGNRVCIISPDEKQVHTLVHVESPADIEVSRNGLFLYVPLFMKDSVHIYRLAK